MASKFINNDTSEIFFQGCLDGAKEINEGGNFDLIDRKQIKQIVDDNQEFLPKSKVNIPKDQKWNEKRIRSSLMQSALKGESIPKLANRLGIIVGMSKTSAVRNARTMMTASHNMGKLETGYEAVEMGIQVKKKWIATFDNRTRTSHALLHGEVVDMDEEFSNGLMFPADPDGDPAEVYNCRCTMALVQDEEKTKGMSKEEFEQNVAENEARKEEFRQGNKDLKNQVAKDVSTGDELKLDNIWKPNGDYQPAETQREFMTKNIKELKSAGVRDIDGITEQYQNTMMQSAVSNIHKVDEQTAVDIIRDKIPNGTLNAWFVDADSSAKPKILEYILGDTEVLNSGWNIAYRNFYETVGNRETTFEEFMSTPIKMYRGTKGQKEVKDDVWVSFSMDKKIAEKFGDSVEEITIKPLDTWGAYQTTAEAEMLIPIRMLEKIRGK